MHVECVEFYHRKLNEFSKQKQALQK